LGRLYILTGYSSVLKKTISRVLQKVLELEVIDHDKCKDIKLALKTNDVIVLGELFNIYRLQQLGLNKVIFIHPPQFYTLTAEHTTFKKYIAHHVVDFVNTRQTIQDVYHIIQEERLFYEP